MIELSAASIHSSADALALYGRMVEIRHFEDEVARLFERDLIRGSIHLCQGQEAVSVGAVEALEPGDGVACTYRGHGVVLAMGADVEASFAEILGRAGGLCGGKGGSMHLTDLERGLLGSFAIVGAHLPIVVGWALAASQRRSGKVGVAFFGDGSTNIGAFHEALNLAAVWRLPVVFVCENNLYGEYTPIAVTTPIERISDRAAAYRMPGVRVDGNDVIAVKRTVGEAVARARAGDGPTLVEALTYRHHGHSRSDPGLYRPRDEVESWLARDPIEALAVQLLESKVASAEQLDATATAARARVEEARNRALAQDEPAPERRFEGVFA